MLAIIEAKRAGLLNGKYWMPNIIAGFIVGVVALPLAMAFAIASGVKPEQGLYTAIIAAFIVAICGGSRVQVAGPTGAFIVILANITSQYGVNGLQVASLMAGVMLMLMGWAKLGNVVKFIPRPVITGFTSGIAVIIFVGEWKDFFGLPVNLPLNMPFHEKVVALFQALPHLNYATTALALLSLLVIVIRPKFIRRIPGPLIAMLVITTTQAIFHFKNVATLGSTFGEIPQHLPHPSLPNITFDKSLDLIGAAFTIALLGAIESLLSATAADGMAGTRHNSNQELIGQGLANILAPLFGGFAATGAIARTATNVRNGGNCPIAAIVHSFVLLLVLVLLAPLAANIPLCTLAAILFVVSYNMSDIPHFILTVKHAPRYDIFILLVTFFLTLFTNLVIAVNIGVILAMMFFVRRMHQSVIIEHQQTEDLKAELAANGLDVLPKNILVYRIQGPFFFGATEKIEQTLSLISSDLKAIIFRLKDMPFIDMTGLEIFYELIKRYHQRGIDIYLCEANPRVTKKLDKIGILKLICLKNIFNNLSDVLNQIQKSGYKTY